MRATSATTAGPAPRVGDAPRMAANAMLTTPAAAAEFRRVASANAAVPPKAPRKNDERTRATRRRQPLPLTSKRPLTRIKKQGMKWKIQTRQQRQAHTGRPQKRAQALRDSLTEWKRHVGCTKAELGAFPISRLQFFFTHTNLQVQLYTSAQAMPLHTALKALSSILIFMVTYTHFHHLS